MEDKDSIVFNFYGGTQQINPKATTAIQNFYGDRFAKEKLKEDAYDEMGLSEDGKYLARFVKDVTAMPRYLDQLAHCETTNDFAQVVVALCNNEPSVTRELVVKEEFFMRLYNLAPRVAPRTGADNIRKSVNKCLETMRGRR